MFITVLTTQAMWCDSWAHIADIRISRQYLAASNAKIAGAILTIEHGKIKHNDRLSKFR